MKKLFKKKSDSAAETDAGESQTREPVTHTERERAPEGDIELVNSPGPAQVSRTEREHAAYDDIELVNSPDPQIAQARSLTLSLSIHPDPRRYRAQSASMPLTTTSSLSMRRVPSARLVQSVSLQSRRISILSLRRIPILSAEDRFHTDRFSRRSSTAAAATISTLCSESLTTKKNAVDNLLPL